MVYNNYINRSASKQGSLGLVIFIIIFNFAYFRFFRPLGLSDDLLKAIYYAVLVGSIFYCKEYLIAPFNDNFATILKIFALVILLSILSAFVFWGQSLLDTFVSTIPYFSFLFYFVLLKANPSPKEVEKAIWAFLLIYIFCFYAALAVAPTRIFTGYGELEKAIDTERGMARIRLTLIGAGPLYIGFFLAISRFKKTQQKIWVLYSAIIFLTIVFQLGRQAIFYSFILGLLYYLDNLRLINKVFISLIFASGLWLLVNFNPVISALIEKSETEYAGQNDGDENARIGAYKFYLFEVSPNVITSIIGNGQYSLGKSEYGDYIDRYGRSQGYIPADVGYASIYLYFGIFGILIFIALIVAVLRLNVASEFLYLKYYIVFLYTGNVAGSTLLGSVPLLCLALYLLRYSNYNLKMKKKEVYVKN